MFKEAKVLVTGGAGFVGVNLVRRLLEKGASVRATLHRKDAVIDDPGVEYCRADLTNSNDCRRVAEGMEYAFLCAANTSGAGVMDSSPMNHLTSNVIMNVLMLEAAHQAGLNKVLFISSSTVYPVTDFPVGEGDVTGEFFDKYFIVAWMKRFSEIVCEMYSTKLAVPLNTVVVRPANLYGPYDDFEWETSHVLPALIRRVVERQNPLSVWGDGSDIKDFIYVDDFVEGMLRAMEKLTDHTQINLASGNPISLKNALQVILRVDGYADAEVVYDKTKPTMIPKRMIDPSKASTVLDFEASTSFEAGIEKTIAWYRRQIQA